MDFFISVNSPTLFILIFLKVNINFIFLIFALKKYSLAHNLPVAVFSSLNVFTKHVKKALWFTLISRTYKFIHLSNKYLLYTYYVSDT